MTDIPLTELFSIINSSLSNVMHCAESNLYVVTVESGPQS